MTDIVFERASQLKKHIGEKVFWDDVGSRYVMLRCGIVEEVHGRNILIDGDWKLFGRLKHLRSFKGKGWGDVDG